MVVGIKAAAGRRKHTVVPDAVAEEDKITRLVGCGGGAVVEHFQITAVRRHVRCAAAELVVKLVSRHNVHSQRVFLLTVSLQPLCLRTELLRCGDDNHHVCLRIGMMVLIGYAIYILWCGDVCRPQIGSGKRIVVSKRGIIEAHWR